MPGLTNSDGPLRDPPRPAAHALAVTRTAVPGGLCLALTGELDLDGVPIADRAFRDAAREAGDFVLDLRELTFMDAAGLAVVIGADRRARAAGRRFVVRVRSSCVRRLFELARAERWLEVVVDPAVPTVSADGNGGMPGAISSPDLPERFGWEVVRDASSARIAPVGELDLDTRPQLERAIDELRRSGVDRLILDLRRVSFLDSSGLRLALDLHTAANGDGFKLELIPGPPHVQRVFELTGTLDTLPFAHATEG